MNYAKDQYELVQESRKVLFTYCKTIADKDFINENNSFGRGGSMRNLLVHIANTYQFWIGKHALGKNISFTTYDSIKNIDEIVELFDSIDSLMNELFAQSVFKENKQISFEINGIKNKASVFKLFTHVITHEFHHKGQILSISRHLGYTPVDTDIMR